MKQAEKDEKVLRQISRSEVRWYHFLTPIAINIVTDGECTDSVKRLAKAGRIDLGEAEPGSYSVPSLIRADDEHFAGEAPCCAAGPGSTSPEPGPLPVSITPEVAARLARPLPGEVAPDVR